MAEKIIALKIATDSSYKSSHFSSGGAVCSDPGSDEDGRGSENGHWWVNY